MTFVEAAFFFPCVVCAISVLWLLAYVPRNVRQNRMNEVGGLDDLDELRWKGWTLLMGWPPVTCWRGCADLHRDDWWRGTCIRHVGMGVKIFTVMTGGGRTWIRLTSGPSRQPAPVTC